LFYLLNNTVRHVRLNAPHPENLTPSCQEPPLAPQEANTG
jgi:hypothetical protein